MTTQWLLVGLVILLLFASAFFVAAEFSLISARRSVIEPLAISSARARSTLKAMEDVSLMMACAQLGITLCAVLLGALGEPAVAKLLEPLFDSLGVPAGWLHPVALTVALVLVVGAHVALGEMVPKNIAIASPESVAMLLAPPLRMIVKVLGPVLRVLNKVSNSVVRKFGVEPRDEVASAFTREEVAGLVAESREEGLLRDEEHLLLTSALDFDEAKIAGIVVPDSQVVSVPEGASAADVELACARTGFSRFPVRADDGRYTGYLHIRDVVSIDDAERDLPIEQSLIRPLPVLPLDTNLRKALDQMRRAGAHLAQVSIAGTGTPVAAERSGVVMLEDAIEQLIGEVRDATRRRPEIGRATRRVELK
ncbi:HlyC/CorC family transporter [Nakamurella antarctica]|uniref:HlyC/CorC family transporter n=1 Tax=Nakamurella antarctica TaxID=1902245 RepID=A0A3G8ZM55_9ACTN|nr:hemolysin family protein [Nakamurella antarctica]AZI57915.1 HlyC/CorC family transporter [Nakamurella antarctica]